MSEARASKSFAVEERSEDADYCSDGALSPYQGCARGGVETSTERHRYTAPLLWLNLVCLDAPLVAVAWQQLFATTFAGPVSAGNRAALFLTAWLIYLADRFGDSVSLARNAPRSVRQEFCMRHRKSWLLALGCLALLDAGVIATRVTASTFVAGVVIGGFALIYLVLNHRWSQLWLILPVKEITIGILFAAGTIASLLPVFPPLTAAFLSSSALFAILCTLNCICIARWERWLDHAQGRGSIATAWPRVAEQACLATLLLAGVAFALGILDRDDAAIYLCIGVSAGALAALDAFGQNLLGDVRTACADLVLLTPIAIILWWQVPAPLILSCSFRKTRPGIVSHQGRVARSNLRRSCAPKVARSMRLTL